jgi:hypothetical protein
MRMKHSDLYSMNNFDFLARSFARMAVQGQTVNIEAVTGNMADDHRHWFCQRYELYCQQARKVRALKLEH